MGRAFQIMGVAVGLFALALQCVLTVNLGMANGRSFFGSLILFFSFFTILTNIAAVLVHVSLLSPAGYAWFPAFAGTRIRAAVAVAISVVFIVYATVLASLWQPHGLFLICDALLHYVAPILYVLWWLGAGAQGTSRWRDISLWLIYPLAYLAYVLLVRAPLAGEAPYPFLDIAKNGFVSVAEASLAMVVLFVAISVVAVAADRQFGRRR